LPKRGGSGFARSDQVLGLLLALIGVIVLSPDALLIRLVDEGPWVVLFWRGAFTTLALTFVLATILRGRLAMAFQAILPLGLLVAVPSTGSNASFVVAVTSTSAANVLVIVGAAPLFAALFSRVFLDERIPPRTWLAIACVIGAVGLVFLGTERPSAHLGNVVALFGALCSAGALTVLRRARGVNMVPSAVVAAALTCVLSAPAGAIIPDRADLALLAVQGSVGAGAIALLIMAVRYLPAPEVSLIYRLELVLGPLWVWAVLGEAPAPTTILSGIVIATTLSVHSLLGMRAERRAIMAESRLGPIDRAASDEATTAEHLVDP
jgi:drug/metabolite transporter (DMT)-like permease